MPKPVKSSSAKGGRTSASGRFLVAKPAVKSTRFTSAQIKKAVRSVVAPQKGGTRKGPSTS